MVSDSAFDCLGISVCAILLALITLILGVVSIVSGFY